MNLTIVGTPEPVALGSAVLRAERFRPGCTVEVICNERTRSGWLEYLLSFKNDAGVQDFLIVQIQREPGLDFEYHS